RAQHPARAPRRGLEERLHRESRHVHDLRELVRGLRAAGQDALRLRHAGFLAEEVLEAAERLVVLEQKPQPAAVARALVERAADRHVLAAGDVLEPLSERLGGAAAERLALALAHLADHLRRLV